MMKLRLDLNGARHALDHRKHCHCEVCDSVRFAFAASEDTTLRIEVRAERQPARFTWKDYPRAA